MEFLPLSIDDAHFYQRIWQNCPQKTSDYTFLNLWTWHEYYNFSLAQEAGLIWIKDKLDKYRAPVGAWQDTDFTALDFFKENRTLIRVPEVLKNILVEQFKDKIHVEEDRDNAEYIYNQNDLATLKGNKFHKKKNHYNSFNKLYGIDYRSFSGITRNKQLENDIKALQEVWCLWNDCMDDETLQTESKAIQKLIDHLEDFPEVIGGALYVEDKLTAFSLGEKLDETTFVVHFEKAHPEYKGAFQAINKCFAENAASNFEFVNREQDLGNEGLRQAKQTYHPSHFLNKYTINIQA